MDWAVGPWGLHACRFRGKRTFPTSPTGLTGHGSHRLDDLALLKSRKPASNIAVVTRRPTVHWWRTSVMSTPRQRSDGNQGYAVQCQSLVCLRIASRKLEGSLGLNRNAAEKCCERRCLPLSAPRRPTAIKSLHDPISRAGSLERKPQPLNPIRPYCQATGAKSRPLSLGSSARALPFSIWRMPTTRAAHMAKGLSPRKRTCSDGQIATSRFAQTTLRTMGGRIPIAWSSCSLHMPVPYTLIRMNLAFAFEGRKTEPGTIWATFGWPTQMYFRSTSSELPLRTSVTVVPSASRTLVAESPRNSIRSSAKAFDTLFLAPSAVELSKIRHPRLRSYTVKRSGDGHTACL